MLKNYYKTIIWTVLVGLLCFTPGNEFKEVKINIPHFDKVVHFGMFYVFGMLIKARNLLTKHAIVFLLVVMFYALAIEIIQQYFIPFRNGDWVDFTFDLLGLFTGVFTFKYYPHLIQRLAS